jgi:uncharacterized protein
MPAIAGEMLLFLFTGSFSGPFAGVRDPAEHAVNILRKIMTPAPGLMKSGLCAALLVSTIGFGLAAGTELATIGLSIKGHKLTAEIASTNQTRMTGLMHRFSLRPDHGMLFVFREPQPQAFWMKNTYVALSIAYIDRRGRIVNIEDMAPQTENTHPSNGPVLYALEMKKGWFKERGIDSGAVVDGLDKAPLASE